MDKKVDWGWRVMARKATLPIMVLGIWWWLTNVRGFGGGILPTPHEFTAGLGRLITTGLLWRHISISLLRIGQGFGLAAGLAIPLGILVAAFPIFGQFVLPSLEFLRQIPPIAWIPVFILALGIGEATKLAVIVYAAFFPVFMNTILGVTQIDQHYWEVARLLQFSKQETLRELIVPGAMASLATGIRLGLSNSWRALVAAEMLAAVSGLGYMIMSARSLVRMDEVFIGILVIGLLGTAFDWGCRVLEQHFLYWQKPEEDI